MSISNGARILTILVLMNVSAGAARAQFSLDDEDPQPEAAAEKGQPAAETPQSEARREAEPRPDSQQPARSGLGAMSRDDLIRQVVQLELRLQRARKILRHGSQRYKIAVNALRELGSSLDAGREVAAVLEGNKKSLRELTERIKMLRMQVRDADAAYAQLRKAREKVRLQDQRLEQLRHRLGGLNEQLGVLRRELGIEGERQLPALPGDDAIPAGDDTAPATAGERDAPAAETPDSDDLTPAEAAAREAASRETAAEAPDSPGEPGKAFTGKVMSVIHKAGLVILDTGRDDGLPLGLVMTVRRDREYLCQVRVTKLYPEYAVAEIIPKGKEGEPIQGDRAFYRP